MKNCSLTHLADHVLLRVLGDLSACDRASTIELLVHVAEVEKRRLYLPLAYGSMYSYCVDELRMSEYPPLRRIRVARAARRFPRILCGIADGRLYVSSVMRLAPFSRRRMRTSCSRRRSSRPVSRSSGYSPRRSRSRARPR